MRGRFRRMLTSRRTFAVLAILLIAGLVIGPMLPVYSSPLQSRPFYPAAATGSGMRQEIMPMAQIDQPGSSSGTTGLPIALSEGAQQPVSPLEMPPPSPAQPLDAATTQTILDRLPPLATEVEDVQELRLPEESLPRPRTGDVITQTFPVTETLTPPEEVTEGPLQVLRFSPEGEIDLAPFLGVTFNQPMVPLNTVEALAAADVPVQLTPELPGIWRWAGTRTLTFEYSGGENERFPMATVFTATVPAGTTSATGETLEEAVTWTFMTPPPRMTYTSPSYGPQPRQPNIFVAFDQRIDPAAVLETVSVTAGGNTYPVQLIEQSEVETDLRLKGLAARAGEGRWLAFKPEQELPAGTTVVVNVGPNTPSAEGPRTTEQVQSFSFETYSALRIERARCSWGGEQCPPLTPFEIAFNNPLDREAFDKGWITVEPEIPGLVIANYDYSIQLSGATQGRTTYKITVDGDVRDIFGQTLGEDQTVEIQTGSASRQLVGTDNVLITVDPSSTTPSFLVYTTNIERIRVRAYAVTPEDWPAYLEFVQRRWEETLPTPPGQQVRSSIIQLESEPDTLIESTIDLSSSLDGATGHLIVVVDVPSLNIFGNRNRIMPVIAWVQVTQIGLDAYYDNDDLVAWATNLQDGAPLAGAEIRFLNSEISGTTGGDGVVRLEQPTGMRSPLLVAQQDGDSAILPPTPYPWRDSGWLAFEENDEVLWYVFDDRALYRPGEEVHVKGWVRRMENNTAGSITLLDGVTAVRYQVMDPQGSLLVDEMTDVNNLGGFDFNFTLPTNVNLGYANIQLQVMGATGVYATEMYHSFQIQEFRRPEFEVRARNDEEGPFFAQEDATVAVSASYFAGGPLPNAETIWNVTASPSTYTPPNWPGWTFGRWVPWWRSAEPEYSSTSYTYEARTDASGTHYLNMAFGTPTVPRPYSVMAEAVVMDVNRQAWASTTNLLVHPASLYVGLRSERTFVEQGDPLEIQAVVVDLDGKPVEDRPIQMRAANLAWEYENNRWQQVEQDVQECTVGSQLEPVSCTFETESGGEYRIVATIQDGQGRANSTELTRWVAGGKRPAQRNVEQEEATLIPNQETYQPGDTAEILVQSPFVPAQGLLTLSRSGIVSTERFTMTESTYTLQIPIEEAYIPNIYVRVDLAGAAERLDDQGEPVAGILPRPAYTVGTLDLAVPPISRTLDVTATLETTEFAPGAETSIDLQVLDAEGAPVEGAELAVVVVDEAILALTGYQLADPVATFYRTRPSNVSAVHGRASLVLADPAALAQGVANGIAGDGDMAMRAMPTMAAAAPAPAAEESAMAFDMAEAESAEAAPGAAPSPITVRTDFNPLALFDPAVRTDAEGKAQVDVRLPDNLTRYRIMVVAVAGGEYYGAAEANLTARLPLMVRPSAPRFLNFGDRFELPIVLQNQTDDPMTVDVVVQAGNLDLLADQGQRLDVPPNDRREVRFPVTTQNAGTARLQIAAVAGDYADAATVDLPVYTPATTEAFATYGVLDEGAVVQPVASPENVFPQFGGLTISTSSTALQALTDAVLYLSTYPYEYSEQLASRILGIAALRDVLAAFEAEGLPDPEALQKQVDADIARLQQLQNDDGGWPIWSRGHESVPYYSIHVAHALARAQQKDFAVPQEMIDRALSHLRNIESYYPHWYSAQTRHALSTYAVYVRDLLGDVDTLKARTLLNEMPLEQQSLEAIAWLWQVLSDDAASVNEVERIRTHVNNRAVETASAANFTTSYGDDAYLMLHSNRRTDAIVLDAMINDQPDSDLIPKIVNGLLAHRTKGRWSNTQENVFVLLALDRYFNTYESVTPDFVARLWLGETYVGSHEFEGRTTDTRETTVPMRYLVDPALGGLEGEGETQDLVIAKEGDGRLYYRLGLRYAPEDLDLDPLDMGFTVQRVYEAVDDPEDVRRDEDGTWHIKAGARVRVKLTLVANNRRYHVALVDPLPAGLEAINPALAVSEDLPADPSERSGWWWWTWYEHQNLRDERAEAFTTLLWEGVYTYSYVARATTPGEFVVPPTKAEEMYSPEVFGRGSSDRVIVE